APPAAPRGRRAARPAADRPATRSGARRAGRSPPARRARRSAPPADARRRRRCGERVSDAAARGSLYGSRAVLSPAASRLRWPRPAAPSATERPGGPLPRPSPGPTHDTATRTEHDLLGDREVPADAYYGVQTLRAQENFHITDVP